MKIEETKLKNGGRILGVNLPDYNSVTINFGFKTGSRTEPKQLSGMSHFLEHMLFKGSIKRPSTKILSREADSIGAQYNAFTGKEYTAYYIKTTKDNFSQGLDIVGDMVTSPLLKQEELDKERGTIIEEIRMYLDNPSFYISTLMESCIFGDTPLGRDIAGTEKTVENIQSSSMKDYYKSHYNLSNVAVAAVGSLPKNYIEQISSYLDLMPSGEKTEWEKAEFATEKIKIYEKDVAQTHLGLMVPGVNLFSEERYALKVTAAILGGYMSARLFSEIREKRGWAYSIWAFSDAASDVGYLGIRGGVKQNKTQQSIELIKKMLLNLRNDITEEEIKRAIGNVKGSASIKLEGTDEISHEILLQYLLTGKTETPQEEAGHISKIKKNDVVEIAEKYFKPDSIYLALIGPFKDSQKFAKIIAPKKG